MFSLIASATPTSGSSICDPGRRTSPCRYRGRSVRAVRQHRATGQPAEAEKLWRAAIGADAKYFPALFNFGVFLHRAQRQAVAAPLLERAVALQPGFQVHFVRGLNHQQLEQRDNAIRAWRSALALQPDNVSAVRGVHTRAQILEAAALAREGLKRFPTQEPLYYLALKALQDAGDMETEATVAADAVRRFPQSARTATFCKSAARCQKR